MNSATPEEKPTTLRAQPDDLTKRVAQIEQGLDRLLQAEKNFTQRLATISGIFWIVILFLTGVAGVQYYLNRQDLREIRKDFEDVVEREKEKIRQEWRVLWVTSWVDVAVKKMKSGSGEQMDSAMWHDIKPLLEHSQGTAEFYDAATIVSKEFLPFMDLAPTDDEFRDSYRHQLWICVYLLESDVEPVVQAVKDHLPSVGVIAGVVKRHLDDPVLTDRQDLEAAWARLRKRLEMP